MKIASKSVPLALGLPIMGQRDILITRTDATGLVLLIVEVQAVD